MPLLGSQGMNASLVPLLKKKKKNVHANSIRSNILGGSSFTNILSDLTWLYASHNGKNALLYDRMLELQINLK